MRLKKTSLRGITVFTQPASVDWDSLGEGIVAVVGPNGSGKSTLLGSVGACLYKSLPDRPGSLYGYAKGKDTYIEQVFDDSGREIKVRLLIDASGKGATEGYCFVDGETIATGAKQFAAEVERLFGSEDLFYASAFASQGKAGNFLQMKPADRKALFAEMLSLSHLDVLSKSAGQKRAAADTDLARQRGAIETVESETAGLAELAGQLAGIEFEVSMLGDSVLSAQQAETAAREALETARVAGAALPGYEREFTASSVQKSQAEQALIAAKGRLERSRKDYEARVRAARQDAESLAGEAERIAARFASRREGLESRKVDLEGALNLEADITECQAEVEKLRVEYSDLKRKEDARQELKRLHGIAAAEERAAKQTLQSALDHRRQRLDALGRQASLVTSVPCSRNGGWYGASDIDEDTHAVDSEATALWQTCPLLAQARDAQKEAAALETGEPCVEEAALAVAARLRFEAADEALAKAITDPERITVILARGEALKNTIATKQAQLDAAKRDLPKVAAELDGLTFEQEMETTAAGEKQNRAAEALESLLAEQIERLKSGEAEVQTSALALAQAEHAARQAWEVLDRARRELPSIAEKEIALNGAVSVRKTRELEMRGAEKRVTELKTRVELLTQKAASLEGLRARASAIEQDLGDWRMLEVGLGKDGVQALEIDAAGPEVARIANELLESCYGPRFSISFETLREKKSKAGEFSEVFDVRVYDAGAERLVEALSGGEKVIVAEAVGLALAIFNCRKSGVRWETLFRDETAGALDPDNAQRYLRMLRRARELGGYSQVIFVAHQPELWLCADIRVMVESGAVSIEGQLTKEMAA